MGGTRYGTIKLSSFTQSVCTMADFQAIRYKEILTIEDTRKVQKSFSELGLLGSYCREEKVHIIPSQGRRNANECLNDLSLP